MKIRLCITLGACLAVAAAGPALAQDPGPPGPDLPVSIDFDIDVVPETGVVDPTPDISVRDPVEHDAGDVHIMKPRFDEAGHEAFEHPGEMEHGSDIEVEPGGDLDGDHGADLTPDVPDAPDDSPGETPEGDDHH